MYLCCSSFVYYDYIPTTKKRKEKVLYYMRSEDREE
jgi:hypothetical protein